MKACIYARTCRQEKLHTTTKIERQVDYCLELARRHNLTVEPEHIFTDVEMPGSLLPTCWADEGAPSRPALSAMIMTLESLGIKRVLVRRFEKLGTSSEVLLMLTEFFVAHDIWIAALPEQVRDTGDPAGPFAYGILLPRITLNTDAEREAMAKMRARKQEEIDRLKAKISRLESEIAALET